MLSAHSESNSVNQAVFVVKLCVVIQEESIWLRVHYLFQLVSTNKWQKPEKHAFIAGYYPQGHLADISVPCPADFKHDERNWPQLLLGSLPCDYPFISIRYSQQYMGLSSAWKKKKSGYAILSRCHGLFWWCFGLHLVAYFTGFTRLQFFLDRFVPYQGITGM